MISIHLIDATLQSRGGGGGLSNKHAVFFQNSISNLYNVIPCRLFDFIFSCCISNKNQSLLKFVLLFKIKLFNFQYSSDKPMLTTCQSK